MRLASTARSTRRRPSEGGQHVERGKEEVHDHQPLENEPLSTASCSTGTSAPVNCNHKNSRRR